MTKLALRAKFVKYTKLAKIPLCPRCARCLKKSVLIRANPWIVFCACLAEVLTKAGLCGFVVKKSTACC